MDATFTNQYQLMKTLSFELRSIGKSEETIRGGFLQNDEQRAKDYCAVKEILDAAHKVLLRDSFKSDALKDIDWNELSNAYETYSRSSRSESDRKTLEEALASVRARIVKVFESNANYGSLTADTPEKFLKNFIRQNEDSGCDIPEAVRSFEKFAGYFTCFQKNRRNIYSADAKATAAANRAVNENFPRFLNNVKIFRNIRQNYSSIIEDAENELHEILNGESLSNIFEIEGYVEFLPQDGIDRFNQILGGYTKEGEQKVRGINEFINLYRQQHKEVQKDRTLALMSPLYKQILSDRSSLSFSLKPFENDAEVIEALKSMLTEGLFIETEAGRVKITEAIKNMLSGLSNSDRIWISRNGINDLSKNMLGSWDALQTIMECEAENIFASESTEKKRMTAISKWLKREAYSLAELSNLKKVTDDGETSIDIASFFKGGFIDPKIADVNSSCAIALSSLESLTGENVPLRERKNERQNIKAALDSILKLIRFIKPLRVDESTDCDEAFYSEFNKVYDFLMEFVNFYNKVRNYMTKQPGDGKKIRVMFDCPKLAAGWDENEASLSQYRSVMFIKDGKYYLGVLLPHNKVDFSAMSDETASDGYRKCVFKNLNPATQFPLVLIHSEAYRRNLPADIAEVYAAKTWQKGANFDLGSCRKLIDYYKSCLKTHKDWQKFNFKFSPTESYSSMKDFYDEVSEQAYSVRFMNIPCAAIDGLVESGEMCLFEIWSKDFSEYSKGNKPNLQTLYWMAAFSNENASDYRIAINGSAKIFYRPAEVKTPFRHKVGENMLNRRGKNGAQIPGEVFGELFDHVSGKSDIPLSKEAEAWIDSGELEIKQAKYEIIKDRRFAHDQFSFDIPIRINLKKDKKCGNFNENVRDYLRANPNVNIIGLDRGERNLIYISVLNRNGDILEQRSLNLIRQTRHDGTEVATDYQEKLSDLAKERKNQRLSWDSISKIANLKNGYISNAVHEIAELVVKYNAIVVLEDLNCGFKRLRTKVEQQVYQDFEIALIKKLNYLVFKDKAPLEAGGVLNGFQLTGPFEKFENIGKQTGFIFYVPAGYTSKIDPTTGFTNLFGTEAKKCTNAHATQRFFNAFDFIIWDEKSKSFAFAFDYNNFKTGIKSPRSKWVVYSASRRLVFSKEKKATVELNPTQIIIDAVKNMGLALTDGFDLKAVLSNLEPSRGNVWFFKSVFYAFDKTLHLRNSNETEDYIESPVLNAAGEHFDSRTAPKSLPQDADANGAYHIALKGIMFLNSIRSSEKPNLAINNEDWFKFAQELAERKIGGIAK